MALERKKLQAELARVTAAKLEQDYLVEQRLEEISRLKAQMEIQIAKEIELNQKLSDLKD